MIYPFQHRSVLRWMGGFLLLVVCAWLVSLSPVGAGTPAVSSALRAQPVLLSMAAEHPAANVGVIVQKTNSGASVEGLVTRLGGTVTKDLHIINAFLLIGLFPFTRLVHILVVPNPYLWRSPQVVRWYGSRPAVRS